jgi:flavin prenyltransferase
MSSPLPLIVAMTGASGSIYAVRLLQVLLESGQVVHLTLSQSACVVLERELELRVAPRKFQLADLLPDSASLPPDHPIRLWCPDYRSPAEFLGANSQQNMGELVYHHCTDFGAGMASGSFLTRGMVICPCSMGTLANIAGGHSENLIQRAADVHLKEHRKLIVVPRETPISSIQLKNMQRLSQAGGVVMPAMPGYYHQPRRIQDLVDFVVGRICDHLQVAHHLFRRWGDADAAGE